MTTFFLYFCFSSNTHFLVTHSNCDDNVIILRLLLTITNNVASYIGDSVERREYRFMVLANIVKSSRKLQKYCTHDAFDAGNFNRYANMSVYCEYLIGEWDIY